ncbi:TSUP family transporter [Candidatus Thiothrix sp. Deng01]|uniref:Probable membrane transporter protein n=1 Tax=Candidatus Thiothrix phosphatis TaxID=3112415 RepID=A0ABU6CX44_9GAMM|nr:TSUP family transporter [Candidatus Thiothrix sp. Deng01]MEB4591141.1 TSUP family transporter [Candidatus Thiothrix sp. Deng01]
MELLLTLFAVAMLAGWVDSIGGGGGLISIPALLWAGFSPLEALATNKLQASFGSSTATLNYARHGLVDVKGQRLTVALTFLGSMGGALMVQQIDASLLEKAIPVLLMLFALYFLLSPKISDLDRQQLISPLVFALTVGFGVGFYDGFFGPGTGTFFTMGYVTLLGLGLPKATGNTKLLNFTSNFAALLLFAVSGHIVWQVGLAMAAGQMIGSYVGSHMAVRHGTRLIRPVLVTVSVLMSLKLLLD